MNKPRLKEYEALRGLSILLLLALHSEIFDPIYFGERFRSLGVFVASFLLGSFFFLAGYFTEVSINKPNTNILRFGWSKFIRIFPPYWFALALFIYVLEYNLNRSALIVYLLNLQSVFAPVYVKSLLTLWYISMLVVFYLFGGSLMLVIRSSLGLLIAFTVVFFLVLWAHLTKGFFDPRFFQYYVIFVAGVFFCRFETTRTWIVEWNILIKIFLAVVSVVILQRVLDADRPMVDIFYIPSIDFYILSWVLLWLTIFRTGAGNLRFWAWLSTASFFTYLIHRPLWRLIDNYFSLEPGLSTILVHLVPGALLALLLGYVLQRGYDRLLAFLHLK